MQEPHSTIQRLFFRWLPRAWAEDMRAESLRWRYVCGGCGHARTVWEMGGIRWKGQGNPRTRLTCPACGNTGWQPCHYE